MMEKERTTRRSLLRALYLLPLVCISLALNAQTKVNYVFKNPSDQDSKVTIARITYDQDTLKYSGALIYENQEPGKEVMNMEAYKLPDGTSVDDAIKSLPGVQVDEDGNITVNGKPVKRIMVNGQDTYLKDGETPLNYLNEVTTLINEGKYDEVIEKMPGVTRDQDGNITVNGKAVSKILVNGEEVELNKTTK